MKLKFIHEMDSDFLCDFNDGMGLVCQHPHGLERCEGKLDERPGNCPLEEVKDE